MKILYITKSERKVREFREVCKKRLDALVTIDSLFDLDYDVIFNTPTKDIESNTKKVVLAVWKKEKDNYDYVIADGYGLFSEYAQNILGVETDTWWPGTQRERSEALVNLFFGVKDREIYYRSVFIACDKKGNLIISNGYLYGYLAKRVKENNGEGYDNVFITKDGRHLSSYTQEEINSMSARNAAIEQLVAKLS